MLMLYFMFEITIIINVFWIVFVRHYFNSITFLLSITFRNFKRQQSVGLGII